MINFDDYTNENKTEHNLKWSYIPGYPYKMLIIGGFGSEKTCISKFNKHDWLWYDMIDMIADMTNNKKP